MKNHYELLKSDTKEFLGTTLYRVRYLKDGQLGGYIEKESNLAQGSDAYISGNAQVCGNARVSGNAHVFGNAYVSDNARVYGNAYVSDNARVYGNAYVSDSAQVFGDAYVSDNARVYGNAHVSDSAQVFGDAHVSGNARVCGNAKVSGDAHVSGNARVCGDARVSSTVEIFCASGALKYSVTITPQNVSVGCQLWPRGKGKRLSVFGVGLEKAKDTFGLTQNEYEALMAVITIGCKLIKKGRVRA